MFMLDAVRLSRTRVRDRGELGGVGKEGRGDGGMREAEGVITGTDGTGELIVSAVQL